MEPDHGYGNNKFVELHPEAKHDDIDLAKEGSILDLKQHLEAKHDDCKGCIGDSRSSSSSSSSLTTDDDEETPFNDSFHKAKQDGAQSTRHGSISPLDVSIQTPQWSMVSVSPRGGSGNLYSSEILPRTPQYLSSMTKSPPIQAMGRGYDPNRIPSSIFSNKPATPMDWSVTSNESLFSIHMGNNSFSRDFTRLHEDWSNSPSILTSAASESKSQELNNFPPNLPPVNEAAAKSRTNMNVREGIEEEFQETPKIVSGKTVEDHSKLKLAPDADQTQRVHLSTSSNLSDGKGVPSDPRVSNERTQSSDSFAFPVLLSDGGKGVSMKVKSENPDETTKSQPQDPKSTPKAATANWFSCITCWTPPCC
ncbi:hypothetical protein ACH5RR_011250 [Cinchona calisaya]|uniref:Uncharacterized protein n=1 Tax=Cinchona calisaya TaxID=153742 RepID=A0ABD3A5S7_9GENT